MKWINFIIMLFLLWPSADGWAVKPTAAPWSTAGFYVVEGMGRSVWSMNPGWLLHRGDIADGASTGLDDSGWTRVSLPNGIELLPEDASGGKNYQGPVWYRKHFEAPKDAKGKKLFIHFEAIMGRSEVWLNGERLVEHTGGYLPVIVDVTDRLLADADNLLAVRADNSDDGSYPPGKPQYQLDFAYFGGIYRDCWLIASSKTYITDPNVEHIPAGGGLTVSYANVSDRQADVNLSLHVRNDLSSRFRGKAELWLETADGRLVSQLSKPLDIPGGSAQTVKETMTVRQPALWSPETPYLYNIYVRVNDAKGRACDGYRKRIGIRSIDFRGSNGLWLNGKPYEPKLIGGNRHQDFAVVGNAMTNSQHYRDALKLRSAGMTIVRNAHYPQDPAFMDACDELGIFVIETTPGWQYWNSSPQFAAHVYDDIRQIMRRDRNRPCLLMFEPILNETHYPDTFAVSAVRAVREEYPWSHMACACDSRQSGRGHFDVWYCHPPTGNPGSTEKEEDTTKTYFTREFGDIVDNWNSQNSISRAARSWGEVPQLLQALHYGNPPYRYTTIETLWQMDRRHLGGCLWHPFEYQRGYHPDPLYSGPFDAFRQEKYAYYMFASQQHEKPMVFIANELTPFSPNDITVYSNCDSVRLTIRKGGRVMTQRPDHEHLAMPSPILTFPSAWDYVDDTRHGRNHGQDDYYLAEGYIDGKVVATHKRFPARRPARLMLKADDGGMPLRADGSDLVTIICSVCDENGNIRVLNNEHILFSVEGEGQLLGNEQNGGNPVNVSFGTAPILLRATTNPGTIRVKAQLVYSGNASIKDAEMTLTSIAPEHPLLFDRKATPNTDARPTTVLHINPHEAAASQVTSEQLKEVERQQKAFQ